MEHITIAELVKRLDVTLVTVNNWRQGSTVRRPLPVEILTQGKRRCVRISRHHLKQWLAMYRPDLLARLEQVEGASA
jgi:hypothetical protein